MKLKTYDKDRIKVHYYNIYTRWDRMYAYFLFFGILSWIFKKFCTTLFSTFISFYGKSCHDQLKIALLTAAMVISSLTLLILYWWKKNHKKRKNLSQYVVKFVILLKISFLYVYSDLQTLMMPLYMYYYRRSSTINLHL